MKPEPSPSASALPYRDTKPKGAADFYFAINATFRFLLNRFGHSGWRQYLENLGRDYFAPVNRQWQIGGLRAIAEYRRVFFAAEPGADVGVTQEADGVRIEVRRCPAIHCLRAAGRTIVPEYCQHCYILGAARASAAGFAMRLEGGNGACTHTYCRSDAAPAPQDMSRIQEAI